MSRKFQHTNAGDCNGRSNKRGERSIGDIGLYLDVGLVPASLVGALDDDDDAAEGGGVGGAVAPDSDLPVVLRRLARRGYRPNEPVSVLNEVDNMNYHGAKASLLEMLGKIRRRLGHVGAPGTPNDSNDGKGHPAAPTTKALRLADVGSGFGGRARVMCNAPLPPFSRTTTICVAVELQRHIHDAARVLTRMAELSGNHQPNRVVHVCGDAVTGEFDPPSLVPADGSHNAVVSRLAILHVPMDAKVPLLQRFASWLRSGGVLALEDYATRDDMPQLTDVYVPDGILPTASEWRTMLTACGFEEVVIEDVTQRWPWFVGDRARAAEAEGDDGGRKFDLEMGGGGDGGSEAGARQREFFTSIPPKRTGYWGCASTPPGPDRYRG